VFRFRVPAENKKLYFLHSGNKIWFPEYRGRIWIDANTSSLLRLERETPRMPRYPIHRMKTIINYAQVALGDGTSLVLPTYSEVSICMGQMYIYGDNCGNNVIKFSNWQKFRATTNIVMNPENPSGTTEQVQK
jgi:hypothetical protein